MIDPASLMSYEISSKIYEFFICLVPLKQVKHAAMQFKASEYFSFSFSESVTIFKVCDNYRNKIIVFL